MTTRVELIAAQVKSLPDEERAELLDWLADYELQQSDAWDALIAEDARPDGRLGKISIESDRTSSRKGSSRLTRSFATSDFWIGYRALPPEIRRRARAAYALWRSNLRHPSPCFKKVGDAWSVRIGKSYRALALLENDTYYWF